MLDVAGSDQLVVIANTGDDLEIYGAYVSPDPDLVTFWLADEIDARGWGLSEDTFKVMDGLRQLGGFFIMRMAQPRKSLAETALNNLKITARGNELEIRTQVTAASLAALIK